MRLFRDEEAARKAGAIQTGMPLICRWFIPVGDTGAISAQVLTDRERALLEALEGIKASINSHRADINATVLINAPWQQVDDLLHSLNVE